MKSIKDLMNSKSTWSGDSSPERREIIDKIVLEDVKKDVISSTGNVIVVTARTSKGHDVVIALSGNHNDRTEVDRPVTVSCTCKDFEFTFSEANSQNGCLFGAAKNILPDWNSSGDPGLCKHLLKLIKEKF